MTTITEHMQRQRIDHYNQKYDELRDSLDQNELKMFAVFGFETMQMKTKKSSVELVKMIKSGIY